MIIFLNNVILLLKIRTSSSEIPNLEEKEMIKRHIKKVIDYAIEHFPCIILTGPRQVGKTTLLTEEYENKGFSYVTMDNTNERLLAKNDPKSFLKNHPCPIIIDEVQKATELFPEIEYIINEKRRIEGNKAANGMFILSGSSRKDLLEKTQESLAGRAALLEMSTLSLSEIYKRDNIPFLPDTKIINDRCKLFTFNQNDVLEIIVKGQLPELYDDDGLKGPIFYSSFISTYLEKDVKDLVDLKDESKFYNLLILVASLTGQEINYDNLAKQIGVSATSIKKWISIMVKTGIIYLIEPYYETSWTKRIVKSPKVYFFDTGIASYLLGIDSKETLARSFLKGRLFETFVINEIRKTYENDGDHTKFYYYRDYEQHEVDIVFVKKGTLYAIECKFGENHSLKDVSSFKEVDDTQYEKGAGCIICTTEELSALSKNILVVPVKCI